MAEDENKNKVTGDKSWSSEDIPVTNWQHGVGGGKLHNLKSCSSEMSCENGINHQESLH